MTTVMNFASISLLNFGSGRMVREGAAARRDIAFYLLETLLLLRALGAVLRTALLAVVDAGAVERTAHGVVAHAGKILYATAADQHHRVLLQVVTLATDVAGHLIAVDQAHAAHLAQRRVRLLRSGGIDTGADAALLRGRAQGGHLGLLSTRPARCADQLIGR